MDMLGRFSRGSMAWRMGDYETTGERNSRGSVLVRKSKAAAVPGVPAPPKPKLPKKQEVRPRLFWRPRFFSMWIRGCSLTALLLLMLSGSLWSVPTVCDSRGIATATSVLWVGGSYSHGIKKTSNRGAHGLSKLLPDHTLHPGQNGHPPDVPTPRKLSACEMGENL